MSQPPAIFPLCIFKGEQSAVRVTRRADVQLQLNDLGLIRAYGVFDYLRTYNRQPFRLPDYLDRFGRSAALLGLELPLTKSELTTQVDELITQTNNECGSQRAEYGLRFLLTGGPSADGFTISSSPTLIVLIESVTPPNPRELEAGVKLISCEYLRDLPAAKTTNYLNAVRLYPKMKREGAAELLYCWQGQALEASRANLFACFGNTRKSVLEIAAGRFAIEERPLSVSELSGASELFITGSGRMITPVVQLDETIVGRGAPGPVTRALIDLFREFTGYASTAAKS